LGTVLREALDYLEIEASVIRPVDLYESAYGKSITASPEEDKISQYKRVFKDNHYALLDNPEFRETLTAFGYKW
jgi:hypothetical protein